MQFNITFKTIFEYILKKVVLCIQIPFVSTEKTTRIASRASCCICHNLICTTYIFNYLINAIIMLASNCNQLCLDVTLVIIH